MILSRSFLPCFFLISLLLLPSNIRAEAHQTNADMQFEEAVTAIHTKDYKKALTLFRSLADNDFADAQFNAALLIKAGMGQPRNFSEAYFWAVLSDLGGETRAQSLVLQLANILPIEEVEANHNRILDRLAKQLANGNASAIIKFARLHFEFLTEPHYETAYIWYSIAQAIGIKGGFEGSTDVSNYLDTSGLIAAQKKSVEIFEGSSFAKK